MSSRENIVQSPTSYHHHNDGTTAFADDPVRGGPLSVSKEYVHALQGKNYLSTRLIDYLLQLALKDNIPSDLLIGSANAFAFFNTMNKKNPKNKNNAQSIL